MASSLRCSLVTKVVKSLKCITLNSLPVESQLASALKINPSSSKTQIEMQLPLQAVFGSINYHERQHLSKEGSEIVKAFELDDCITGIALSPPESKVPSINFKIDVNHYTKGLLYDILGTQEKNYVAQKLFDSPSPEQVIVEFSSPNIAKPFHVGHLRSTIQGNFLSNLFQAMGHNVKRLNYLGDWGTQFGFLQYGLDQGWYSWDEISKSPIQTLLDIYIRANSLAEKDEKIADTARGLFNKLESGDEELLQYWGKIRQFTVSELSRMYSRLGIKFDEFNWESQYGIQECTAVLKTLEKTGHLSVDEKGRKIVHLNDQRAVTLVKSDGSSLYIIRDLAAAIDRQQRLNFHRMYYVVDSAQSDHFVSLKTILSKMNLAWANDIQHVKFGRIKGMSTRKGTAILLTDLLDEAHSRMKANQMTSPNTRVSVEDNPEITDILAVTAVIVHDMRQRRQKDYTFNWDDALQDKGDTGIRLQYTHSRLRSLEKRCGILLPDSLDSLNTSLVQEQELIHLLRDLGRFRQILLESHNQLEPCILVRYLFDLSHSIGVALKTMPVKNQPDGVAQVRLAVFSASRRILSLGLQILGVKPLDEM